ncbi:ABC transporter permease [Candidatus Bipolaricaulota bacterium]|nr:ABC transporter permease [Candidatus Bipolaricaulota bacterium]MBS3793073.1 ABC transporter permease [Candidatus Bipolaricaulota bacterium]
MEERDKRESRSQLKRMWRRFKRHTLGKVGGVIVLLMFIVVFLANFIAPYNYSTQHRDYAHAPPTKIHFTENGHLTWPYVYATERDYNEYYEMVYTEDKSKKYPIKFFVKGEQYSFWGLFSSQIHLFGTGTKKAPIFLFGTDTFGRGLFSRTLWGGWISLSIGPFALVTTLIIAIPIGLLSGFFGGWVDMFIQRITEVVMAFPKLPLWLALALIVQGLPSAYRFFFIVGVFSLVDWTGLSRTLRGMVLSAREEDYVMAAKAVGAGHGRAMFRHILPNTTTYLVVVSTLRIPGWIIAEATISFLGLGIKEPQTSWGLLLSQANNLEAITSYPWLLIPGVFIVVTVLAFNFFGDGIRDAADPFTTVGGK